VTSTFNARSRLPRTIQSIRGQTYANLEWLVIDGGSADGTVELLRQNSAIVDFWLSEPDGGIYDAWNKACRQLRGDWVLFLGAGDTLADGDTLTNFAPRLAAAYPEFSLVYGILRLTSSLTGKCVEEIGVPWDQIEGKWQGGRPALPMHQAVFHHASLLKASDKPFDVSLKIAGDSKFLLQHLVGARPLFVPIAVAEMPFDGVSAQPRNLLQIWRELAAIRRDLDLRAPWGHILLESLWVRSKAFLTALVPREWYGKIADRYRSLRGKPKRWTI
jgi:glycosyltransferase involved in cell wall biosynthesis